MNEISRPSAEGKAPSSRPSADGKAPSALRSASSALPSFGSRSLCESAVPPLDPGEYALSTNFAPIHIFCYSLQFVRGVTQRSVCLLPTLEFFADHGRTAGKIVASNHAHGEPCWFMFIYFLSCRWHAPYQRCTAKIPTRSNAGTRLCASVVKV